MTTHHSNTKVLKFHIEDSASLSVDKVDNRNLIQRFRDWLSEDEPDTFYVYYNAYFKFTTPDALRLFVGDQFFVEVNGTTWRIIAKSDLSIICTNIDKLTHDETLSMEGYDGDALITIRLI